MKIKHKMKVALFSAVMAMGGGVLFTSCEDMFSPDNGLVTDNLSPQDTVYTMMGIVKNMQRIMDRTVIFGELRSDLVDVGVNTPSDLRDIAEHNVQLGNAYSDPRDFYAVINSCNVYLANVDAKRMAIHSNTEGFGEYYFEKEIIATKCFRAWTYLQLAQIYGADNIPFITEPIVTADAADQMVASTSNRTNMTDLCTFFIDDIKQYADRIEDNEELMPDYNVKYTFTQEGVEVSYRKFFIPVRLMLAELYLWRGSYTQSVADYREAVRYYHEFLTHGSQRNAYTVAGNRARWHDNGEKYSGPAHDGLSYGSNFRLTPGPSNNTSSYISYIPMDTTEYYGNTSSVREIFSSKYSKNYYPAAMPSTHLMEISQSQDYFFFDSISPSVVTKEYAPKDETTLRVHWDKRWEMVVGDLRFSSIYSADDNPKTQNANLNSESTFVWKWEVNGGYNKNVSRSVTGDCKAEFIPLYRRPVVYLHMAEALNRAGFPEAAFVILKYGISTTTLARYALSEFEDLQALTSISSQDVNFTEWSYQYFITRDMVSYSNNADNFTQYPIHALGSGESWYDPQYTIGVDLKDSKYAVGDELQYVLDAEGNIIRDEEGNPDLTAEGTKVYNYGIWNSAKLQRDSSVYAWLYGAYSVTSLPYASLLSYEDFLEYIQNGSDSYYLAADEDITAKTAEELQALYDEYKLDYASVQATIKHNLTLKANVRADQQLAVAEKVLTEEALEGMFEGTRFGDLMRFSKQIGNDAFLGQTVAKRKGEKTPDGSLAAKLATEAGWYVPLPNR